MHSTIESTTHSIHLEHGIYMLNLDDKHETRPGFEPNTCQYITTEFQATAGPNEPPEPADVK